MGQVPGSKELLKEKHPVPTPDIQAKAGTIWVSQSGTVKDYTHWEDKNPQVPTNINKQVRK